LAAAGLEAQTISDLTLAFPAKVVHGGAGGRLPMITDSADPVITGQLRELASSYPKAYAPIQFSRFPHSNRLHRPRVYLGKARRWAMDKLRYRPSLAGYLSRMCSSSVVITGRYHAVTMCLLTRTPFMAVESLVPKISWLLRDALGSTRRVFPDLETLTESDLWHDARWTEDEFEHLEHYLQDCRSRNQAMASRFQGAT
jgi:hypothetical protein